MRISGVTYVPRKTHKGRKILISVLVILIVAIAVTALISVYTGWKIIHPGKSDIEPFSSNIAPDYRTVDFKSNDKSIILNGWFFERRGIDRTVILVHDYGKNRLQFNNKTVGMIKYFINNGYNVLTFDLRNSGKSGGKATTLGFFEKEDIIGAVSYVKSQGAKHIILVGFSSGASASLLAAAENSDIDAVIADSPYSYLNNFVNMQLAKRKVLSIFPFSKTVPYAVRILANIDIERANPLKVIENIPPKPVLLIHSKDDSKLSISNSRDLLNIYSQKAAGTIDLWETDGVDHLGSYEKYQDEYMRKILDFLSKF